MAKPNVQPDPVLTNILLEIVKEVCPGDDYQRAVTLMAGDDWDEKDLIQILDWIRKGLK